MVHTQTKKIPDMQFKLSLILLSILDQKTHVFVASSTRHGVCEEDKVKTQGHLAKLPGRLEEP